MTGVLQKAGCLNVRSIVTGIAYICKKNAVEKNNNFLHVKEIIKELRFIQVLLAVLLGIARKMGLVWA